MSPNKKITKVELLESVEEYERMVFDLKQLIEISKGLNSTLEYNVLIDSILLTCMGQMQLLKAGIFLKRGIDDHTFVLHRNYKGFDLHHDIDYEIDKNSRIIDFFESNFRCYTLDELNEEIGESRAAKTLKKIEPSLVVPLKGKDKLNGIILLGGRINRSDFTLSEKEYLLNIASLAGIAIENAYLYELATTDMMTKLKIHHFFQTMLKEEIERCFKEESPLSLIMIDVDNFKSFNDTYGHQCGDVVLKKVADIIKSNCRQIDIAARYGGEEMAIILPRTDLKEAEIVAERIRDNIETASVRADGRILSVTVSAGVAQFDIKRDKNNKDIIGRTDKALYVSKHEGRNRVSVLI